MFNLPKNEKKILKFWQNEKIFAKSIKQRKKRPFFSFYDGPPFASGLPHYGHVLVSVIKDVVLRYWTMQGYQVPRRVGWDCHGLPVENLIEKELELGSKKEIEKFGVKKFNQSCRQSVLRCTSQWQSTFNRLGRWADYSGAYTTMDNEYIESVWWVFNQLWQKKLVYQDYRITPYCPRCGTPLSNFELNQPGAYKDVEDESVYLKFKIVGCNPAKVRPSQVCEGLTFANSYLLVWTTTPWTLPANTAIAVNPKVKYARVKQGKESYILAKEQISVLNGEYKIEKEFSGKELIGLEYQPLYPMKLDKKGYRLIGADFVSVEDGTGLVHIAPAFGEEDMEAGKKENLPVMVTVDEEGKVMKGLGIPGEGEFVKKADKEIKDDLKKRGVLYKEEKIVHSYPFCWRCETPLLYYPLNSWYVAVKQFKEQLIRNNRKINWAPAHLKEGRFGKSLKGAPDWCVSRSRYWGAPMPIWQCQKCGNQESIGSFKGLAQKAKRNNYHILRHGETNINNGEHLFTDEQNKKEPLNKTGQRQICALVSKIEKLKIDLIFASDFFRTSQTAKIISQTLGIKLIFDKRLREINPGIFKGKLKKDYHNFFGDYYLKRFSQTPAEGENLNQVKKRVMAFIRAIDKKYKGKNILIVSHADALYALEGAGQGMKNEEIIAKVPLIEKGELRRFNFKNLPYDDNGDLDLHRPHIDEITLPCSCGGKMKRIPEVFDCWFESGSMPYSQWHYPFRNKKLVEKTFPADFIAEGLDQTRGWFYTLHVLATALTLKNIGLGKDQPAFKNVVVNGLILGEDGRKLSKRLKNYTAPEIIFDKYGADALRYFFMTNTPLGEDCVFSEKRIAEIYRRQIMTLWNSFVFFETYCSDKTREKINLKKLTLLDKWILSRLNNLNKELIGFMDKYELTKASRLFDDFIDDLSNWHIRRSRRRLQKPESEEEKNVAVSVLYSVLLDLTKLMAPLTPFVSEEIFQRLRDKKDPLSVHLCDYPKANSKLINQKLEKEMREVREIVNLALKQRAEKGIKVRQPLSQLAINSREIVKNKELADLIKDEVNVKGIVFGKEIKLDAKITPELKAEGAFRDLIRFIQGLRKDAGLKPGQEIYLRYSVESESLKNLINKNLEEIKREISARKIEEADRAQETFLAEKEVNLDGQKIWLGIKK